MVRVLVEHDPDYVMHAGIPDALLRIVEHGNRIIVSGRIGAYAFHRGLPVGAEDRSVMMNLGPVSSFEFRGNLLAVQTPTNAFALVNLHTFKREAAISEPTTLTPPPPSAHGIGSTVIVRDAHMVFVHPDGSARILQMTDTKLIPSNFSRSTPVPDPVRAASFLTGTLAAAAAADAKKGSDLLRGNGKATNKKKKKAEKKNKKTK